MLYRAPDLREQFFLGLIKVNFRNSIFMKNKLILLTYAATFTSFFAFAFPYVCYGREVEIGDANIESKISELVSKSRPVILDHRTHQPPDILYAALNGFLSKYITAWPSEPIYLKQGTPIDSLLSSQAFRENYSWLSKLFASEKDLNRYFVINKWTQPIRISFGYPNDLKPMTSDAGVTPLVDHISLPQDDNAKAATEKLVVSLAAEIQNLTRLNTKYISHADESSDNLANIRIILVDSNVFKPPFMWASSFKMGAIPHAMNLGTSKNDSILFRSVIEPTFVSAVKFTPNLYAQVDGYFTTNSQNEIQASFCYIYKDHEVNIFNALLKECLFRSLGIPNAIPQNKGVLGVWNGRKQSSPTLIGFKITEEPPDFSDMDRFMVKLLYHKNVKPGMSASNFENLFLKGK